MTRSVNSMLLSWHKHSSSLRGLITHKMTSLFAWSMAQLILGSCPILTGMLCTLVRLWPLLTQSHTENKLYSSAQMNHQSTYLKWILNSTPKYNLLSISTRSFLRQATVYTCRLTIGTKSQQKLKPSNNVAISSHLRWWSLLSTIRIVSCWGRISMR